jgi:dipeptide/tripeptide permease
MCVIEVSTNILKHSSEFVVLARELCIFGHNFQSTERRTVTQIVILVASIVVFYIVPKGCARSSAIRDVHRAA